MTRNNKVKKGGSRASNAVMALNPTICMDYTSPVIEGKPITYDINNLSLYRTTGGGKRSKRSSGKRSSGKRSKRSSGKRSSGKRSKRSSGKRGKRSSGKRSKRNSGKRRNNKRGGSRASNAVMKLGGKPCNQTNKHLGGGSELATLPSHYSTHPALTDCKLSNYLETETQNNQSQQETGNKVNISKLNITGDHPNITESSVPLSGGGSSDWKSTLYSRGSYTAPNMGVDQFKAFSKQTDYMPNDSMRNSSFMKGGKRTRKNKKIQKGSGGSDWKSTLYSRGSYLAPNMDQAQFKAFTKQADYMPNDSMRTAAFMK